MNKFASLAVASALALATSTSSALTFTPDAGGGDGTVTDITAPGGKYAVSFVLVGANDSSGIGNVLTYTASADSALHVSGSYTYFSNDCCGPVWDPFGYVVNGALTQLTDSNGASIQTADFAFDVKPGDVFGWYVRSVDQRLGAAVATVGANLAPVPLPASLPLFGSALAAVVSLRRRR